MSFSPQPNATDYSIFGGKKVEEEDQPIQEVQPVEETKVDYSQFGGKPVEKEPEKVGNAKSILYGFIEAVVGLPALAQYAINEYSKGIEKGLGQESNLSFEEENPLMSYLSKLPESKDQTGRRLRTGTAGITAGAIGGIPGIIAGLVGSQAGQTVRELYGKDGKFDEFGWGEAGAIGADLVAGLGTGIGVSAAKNAAKQSTRLPAIFGEGETALQRASIKNVVQGERSALDDIVNNFSTSQIADFEREASAISPQRYTDLTNSNVAGIQRQADNMHRQGALSTISPLNVTPEQGGRAIQEAANEVFNQEVIQAERSAYSAAKQSAENLSGTAPRTLEEAKKLRANLVATTPSTEQNPVINYLNGLISDLETVTPASTKPASKLLDASGKPVTAATEIAESSSPTVKKANDMITLVQNGNQAVNYSSELREQSHRLIPIINILREETGQVLSKSPTAAGLYADANTLHARNAETWGTKYMRNVRFAENPESIITQSKRASNIRNLKQAVPNIQIQNVAERLIVDDITKAGSTASNLKTVSDLAPELSVNAQNAAHELINVKDPLTSPGGRALVRNQILKDAAQSVNTGKRPDQVLDLMGTPKGYNIVRETLNTSPQGREMFQSFQRLFMEDLFTAVRDPSGRIDFSKAKNVFKNPETRQVAELINPGLSRRLDQLETIATNFENNISLFSQPETKTVLQGAMKNVKDAGVVGALLHALHVPWPVIISLGLAKATAGTGKIGFKALQSKILSNPKALNMLESISVATTSQELAKQIPRLITEIEKKETKKK